MQIIFRFPRPEYIISRYLTNKQTHTRDDVLRQYDLIIKKKTAGPIFSRTYAYINGFFFFNPVQSFFFSTTTSNKPCVCVCVVVKKKVVSLTMVPRR